MLYYNPPWIVSKNVYTAKPFGGKHYLNVLGFGGKNGVMFLGVKGAEPLCKATKLGETRSGETNEVVLFSTMSEANRGKKIALLLLKPKIPTNLVSKH
jgi:hypothetical protein